MIPDKQIKLERWRTLKDGNGNNTETVLNAWHLWAEVTRIGGGRTTSYGITALDNSMEFKIFFRFDVWPTGKYRIVYDGKRYTPQSIVKENEKRYNWVILANSSDK